MEQSKSVTIEMKAPGFSLLSTSNMYCHYRFKHPPTLPSLNTYTNITRPSFLILTLPSLQSYLVARKMSEDKQGEEHVANTKTEVEGFISQGRYDDAIIAAVSNPPKTKSDVVKRKAAEVFSRAVEVAAGISTHLHTLTLAYGHTQAHRHRLGLPA